MDETVEHQIVGQSRRNNTVICAEIAFVVGCVLVAEWAVLPLFGRNAVAGLVPAVAAFVAMIASHIVRREGLSEIGWRVDNFGRSLLTLLPPMLAATGLLLLVGYFFGSIRFRELRLSWPIVTTFLGLFVWGLMQQYPLQGFINRRAQMAWGSGGLSVIFVAFVFALLHLPNFWLTLATFLIGLVWAWAYQRSPNLFALGLSHAVMTVILVLAVPYSALHGLKVGYGYFL